MSKWKYVEPIDPHGNNWEPVEIVMTEDEILDAYYPYWTAQVLKYNAGLKIGDPNRIQLSPQACIEDWVIIHWAEEVK